MDLLKTTSKTYQEEVTLGLKKVIPMLSRKQNSEIRQGPVRRSREPFPPSDSIPVRRKKPIPVMTQRPSPVEALPVIQKITKKRPRHRPSANLGSLWVYFGLLWHHFGTVWGHTGSLWGHFSSFRGHFGSHLGAIFEPMDLLKTTSKTYQEEVTLGLKKVIPMLSRNQNSEIRQGPVRHSREPFPPSDSLPFLTKKQIPVMTQRPSPVEALPVIQKIRKITQVNDQVLIWAHFGVTLGCFGITLEPFGVTLGHFGVMLAHFGIILEVTWV
jgi:hypothetical protein